MLRRLVHVALVFAPAAFYRWGYHDGEQLGRALGRIDALRDLITERRASGA